jgi:type II secretory pathway pseudopilin PulG
VKRRINGSQRAFTLIELLMIVAVIAVVAALLATAGVMLKKTKTRSGRIACISNVKECEMAFMVWSGDNSGKFPMQVSTNLGGTLEWVPEGNTFRHFQAMSNELSTTRVVICPSDVRESATNFTTDFKNQNISYFVGVDASTNNSQVWLCGDRNITNGLPLNRSFMTLATGQSAGWTGEMHDRYGNVAVAGGSVQQILNRELQETMRTTSRWTNRIVLPE